MASMVDRERAEQAARGTQDPEAFREACAVFGDAGALARLDVFRADLETHLSWIEQGRPDHEQLREMAHRTAGWAGLFGFPALAEASAHLDEAVRGNPGIEAALARWTEQARLASKIATDETTSGVSATKDIPPGR
ncbi:Hpt domain-containing protein [Sediminimonas sp.]|uniref:Hpt domain-containing protein n=1 Tax=Sediminimonas sp. TaxID=2823379 RepID=UPI0025CD5261|nr:Hpt domain-containing protein [Sediminimonas sp.]